MGIMDENLHTVSEAEKERRLCKTASHFLEFLNAFRVKNPPKKQKMNAYFKHINGKKEEISQ